MIKEFEKRLLSSIILVLITFFAVLDGETIFVIFISIAFLISSYEWLRMIKRVDIKILGILFLTFSFYSAFYFRNQNLEGFLLIILICVSTDIGGYIFGNLFKGPKIFPNISPNKTFSGSLSAVFCSIIISVYLQLSDVFYIDIIIGLLISIFGQLGDLIESMFKRKQGFKDSGNFIPGHGGFLDRCDSLLLSTIFIFIPFYFNFI